MAQTAPKIRVKSGVPWWLWLMMLVFGGGVLITAVVSAIPEDLDGYYEAALEGFDNSDPLPLRKALEKLDGNPDYAAQVDLLKGLDLMATSRPLKAIPLFKKASKDPKAGERAQTCLGQALFRGGRYVEAIDVMRDAIAKDTDNSEYRNYAILATQLYELGAFEEALQCSEKMLVSDSVPADRRAMTHSLRAGMLKDLERHAEAAKEYAAAIELDPVSPTNSSMALKMAQSLLAADQPEEARKALEMADPSPDLEIVRVECMLKAGEVDAAAKAIEPAMQGGPGMEATPRVQVVYAKVMLNRGKARAEEVLVRVRNLAGIMTRDREFFRVAADVAKMAEQNEEAELYEQNYLALTELEKQYQEQRDAVIRNSTDAAGRMKCGELAGDSGKFELARYWFTAAEKVDPNLKTEATTGIEMLFQMKPEIVPLGKYKVESPLQPRNSSEPPLDQIPFAPETSPTTGNAVAAPPIPDEPAPKADKPPANPTETPAKEPETKEPETKEPAANKPAADPAPPVDPAN